LDDFSMLFNTEVFVSLRLKATVTGRQAVPLLNYALAFEIQISKQLKTSVRAAEQPGDCSLRRLGCLLRDCLGWPAGRQITPVSQVLEPELV
jgi:hypothetical protein